VRHSGRASFRCGLLPVRGEAANRVTIDCWYQRQLVLTHQREGTGRRREGRHLGDLFDVDDVLSGVVRRVGLDDFGAARHLQRLLLLHRLLVGHRVPLRRVRKPRVRLLDACTPPPSYALPKLHTVDTRCTTSSLTPTVDGNTVRSFSAHSAQASSTTVSRADIRLIQHLDSSAHGLVRRRLLIGYFPIPPLIKKPVVVSPGFPSWVC
jgi:hypothetical protein